MSIGQLSGYTDSKEYEDFYVFLRDLKIPYPINEVAMRCVDLFDCYPNFSILGFKTVAVNKKTHIEKINIHHKFPTLPVFLIIMFRHSLDSNYSFHHSFFREHFFENKELKYKNNRLISEINDLRGLVSSEKADDIFDFHRALHEKYRPKN